MIAPHCAIQCHRLHRLGTGPAQRVQNVRRCDDIKNEMTPEECIAAGKSINEAVTAFRECVNQLGPPRALSKCLVLNLDQIEQLLSEPITQEEAQALLDVLYKRRWMEALLRWLSDRPVPWEDFPTYEANLREEAKRKLGEDREVYRGVKLFPDERFPKISDSCPDCGSSEWKRIVYGSLTEEGVEAAKRGEFVRGGCVMGDASRYCTACFNRWPTKPDMSRPGGTPEAIQRHIEESRAEYARLSALAELPPHPEEPRVERAWARIDGSVRFLVRFGNCTDIVAKDLQYARLGGAPTYSAWPLFWCSYDERARLSTLAEVAALRFERTYQRERHNLYNNWDIVQAHRRERDQNWEKESYRRESIKEDRKKLSELLKLARSAPEKLPKVVSVRSFEREKKFLVRFAWGVVWVERHRFSLIEPLHYYCYSGSLSVERSPCAKAEDPELAEDLACAAAMLAEFPTLAWYAGSRVQ